MTRPDLPAINLMAIGRACARHTASGYPDLLARSATAGVMDSGGLLSWARAHSADPTQLTRGEQGIGVDNLDTDKLCGFARVLAALVGGDTTVQDVADVLHVAHRVSGCRGLGADFRDLWLDALFLTGATEPYPYPRSRAVESRHWRVGVDELNPFLRPAGAPAGQAPWLAEFSRVFTEHGLSPLELSAGSGPPLHRLNAPTQTGPATIGPLVTVVMPAFDPDETALFALTSILRQSATNLEVLLCDDGSGPHGQEILAQWASLDPRVRVIRSEENRGAYAARNLGLTGARGEFVTFSDIDDWSHPQRIERQLQPLLQDPAAMGTMSRMARVDDRLGLTVLGYAAIGMNASSVLLRRVPVLRRLGGFDTVRRAADNEFVGRVRAVFGPDVVPVLPDVLALVQRTPGSLSRSDMRLLFRHPARAHYRSGYRRWHERIRTGEDSGWVPPPQRVPVPALSRISGVREPMPNHLDVVVLASAADNAPTSPDIAAEVTALAGAGLRLGFAELPAPFDLTVPVRPPAETMVDLTGSGALRWLLAEDGFVTDLAVVRDPAAIDYLGTVLAPAGIRTALLVADYAPGGRYEPARVEAFLTGSCGASVRWLPASAAIAAELAGRIGSDNTLLPPRLWGVVPPVRPTGWESSPQPLVGMVPPSDRLPAEVLATWVQTLVPHDPRTRLWCLTRNARLPEQLGRPVFFPGRPRLSEHTFLRQISYLTVPPTPGRGPHLDRDVIRALHYGCVVFLDPAYRPHFGEAALYPDDRPVDEWIGLHAERPELYRRQQERTALFLKAHLSTEALQDTVRTVLHATTAPEIRVTG